MIDAALSALGGLLNPTMLGTLAIGVLAGLVLGMIPGLGGTGAMAVLLPFVFLLETEQAIALVIGAAAVIHTSDTISAVLLGIPGSASSSVALLDGHTMAKKGQASRALSIAFVSSASGGLIGALGLTLSVAVAGPLVRMFGSPELFMLTVLGISLASLLSQGNVAKGLLAAAFGLLLGQVGAAPTSAEYRYTFDSLFLTEGLDLVAVALGVFGLAEIMALVARRTSVAQGVALGGGWLQGVRDVLQNWTQVIRGALIGVWSGILPGVGATAGAWLAYGQAVAGAKDKRRFGKGDPRGVAAPESASNSISAGDLIPTLLFGIPGSAAAALLLGALLVFGVEPGPALLREDLDLVYTIVWSFAAAAVFGAALCFLLAKPLARLSFVRFPVLAAGLIVLMFTSGFQAAQEFGIMQVMLLLGIIGWLMKMCDYPRAPFLIGFVLSVPLERYYFLTVNLYTPDEWMTHPTVLVMAGVLVAPLLYKGGKWLLAKRSAATGRGETTRVPVQVGSRSAEGTDGTESGRQAAGDAAEPTRTDAKPGGTAADTGTDADADEDADEVGTTPDSALFAGTLWPVATTALFTAVFAVGLYLSTDFSASGRLVPQLVCVVGLLLSVPVLAKEAYRLRTGPSNDGRWRAEAGWTAYAFGWLCLFLLLTYLVGAVIAAAVFVPVFLRAVAELRFRVIVPYTAVVVGVLLILQFGADMAIPLGWFTPEFLL